MFLVKGYGQVTSTHLASAVMMRWTSLTRCAAPKVISSNMKLGSTCADAEVLQTTTTIPHVAGSSIEGTRLHPHS